MASEKKNGLPEMREAISSPQARIDLDAVAQHFSDIAGGPRGLAKLLKTEYDAAEPGSPVRARILNMLMNMLGKLEGRGVDDLSAMSDADLQKELDASLRRMGHVGPAAASATVDSVVAAADDKEAARQEESASTEPASASSGDPDPDSGTAASRAE